MNLKVNGEEREFPEGLTVEALLKNLNLQADRVVLELNRQILNIQVSGSQSLNPGDQLEIVQFVGGG